MSEPTNHPLDEAWTLDPDEVAAKLLANRSQQAAKRYEVTTTLTVSVYDPKSGRTVQDFTTRAERASKDGEPLDDQIEAAMDVAYNDAARMTSAVVDNLARREQS